MTPGAPAAAASPATAARDEAAGPRPMRPLPGRGPAPPSGCVPTVSDAMVTGVRLSGRGATVAELRVLFAGGHVHAA
ncbi:hypothetical protein ACWKWC_23335, partial [Geodermatophilus nigrescens]